MKNTSEKNVSLNRNTLLTMVICLAIFIGSALWANSGRADSETPEGDYAQYENGKVIEILSDNTFQDEKSDGGWRGEQMMTVEVTTGQYKGKTLLVYNYVGPLYGVPVSAGDSVTMIISTYANGNISATVYEYNHLPGILIMAALFVVATILVGGKKGAKSLLGLAFIVANLFMVLFPALMKGAPTVLTTFLMCVLVAAFSFATTSGFNRKTVCAFLGTAAGVFAAWLFSAFSQWLLRIDGLRVEEVEALLQLRQTGTNIGLKGLLSAGIIVSSLGAVMDVTMGLASALSEVHDANPDLKLKDLFVSGMNIGKDMVGTMTSTLILAFLGSGFVLILYLYSLGLGKYQLLSSAYFSIEVISGLSSSIGAILSVPITAFISARTFEK